MVKGIVEFKYELEQKLTTPFDDVGIVQSRAQDDGGIKYYLQTKLKGCWYKESELKEK